jgi:hypothetical protein
MSKQNPITVTAARYIKLGKGGEFENLCFKDGTIRLGFDEAPHIAAQKGDSKTVAQAFLERGLIQKTATDFTRQVMCFYDLSPDLLWITFSQGHLFWCKAEPHVEYLGTKKEGRLIGSRLRKTKDGWHKTDINGHDLCISDLSGNLTKVSAYRSTICDIKGNALDYLFRKINGQTLPVVERAKKSCKEMQYALEGLIRELTPQDFELFVELIFSQSGWQRISRIGGTQKTIDLEFIQPLTNERAIVQVKSQTSQDELDAYLGILPDHNAERSFYVYHSPEKTLDVRDSSISLMGISALAQSALRSGLTEWLIKKIG